jgi:hypothetical protein
MVLLLSTGVVPLSLAGGGRPERGFDCCRGHRVVASSATVVAIGAFFIDCPTARAAF